MNKHYLLTFNQDYADEHDVPALACFTEEQYQQWLATDMIYNRNKNYEQEMAEHQKKIDHYHLMQKLWQEKGLMMKSSKDFTDEEAAWVKLHPLNYVYQWGGPKKGTSRLHASLGNNSDYFGEGYEIYENGQAFVDAKVVKVIEVSEDFHNTFHTAKLDDLSLCNIFEVEELAEYDDEDNW